MLDFYKIDFMNSILLLIKSFMDEVWKKIENIGVDYYEVSNLGRVRSLNRIITYKDGLKVPYFGKILKPGSSVGYPSVVIGNAGNKKPIKVHRLVAEAFLPKIEGKNYINHKDSNRKNNCVDNLEWCTPQENFLHAMQNGRWTPTIPKNPYKAMLGKFGAEHNRSKAVIQYDLQGNEIARFGGTREAGRITGAIPELIAKCCRGERNSHKSYIWKYA